MSSSAFGNIPTIQTTNRMENEVFSGVGEINQFGSLPFTPPAGQSRLGTAGIMSPQSSGLKQYRNEFYIQNQQKRMNQEFYRYNLLSNKI